MTNLNNKISLMVYGASDSGKSTQARYIAEFIWERYQKKTRVIALDRGSLWAPCADLVEKGIVIPLEFPTSFEFNPMAIMRKLRRGEFPENGVINAPTATQVKVGNALETRYTTNTKWLPWTAAIGEDVGAIVIDSLTTFATAYMSDTKQKNVRSGADNGGAPRVEEGEQMGTNTQSHYGDAHTEILDAVQAFQALPVHIVMFTALEGLGESDDSGVKRPSLGPETVGKAINGKLPSRVNHCFHLVSEGVGQKKIIKAWYNKHSSELGERLMWPAKVTLTPVEMREFWTKYPLGYIPLSLETGLGDFLSFLSRKKV